MKQGWREYNLKQARRTAMDRSNIGNSWNREKLVLAVVYRSLAGKINQNSHSQIIISIDILSKCPSWYRSTSKGIMKSDVSTPVYINTETFRMFSFVCQHTVRWSISWPGLYINRLTTNRNLGFCWEMPMFFEVTYYIYVNLNMTIFVAI